MNKQRGLIIGMILIILAGVFSLRKLVFATDLGELQFANSSELVFYEEHIKDYPSSEDGVIIILEKKTGFHTLSDFQWVDEFTESVANFEEISEVSSITNLKIPHKSLLGPIYKPYIDLKSSESFEKWVDNYAAFEDINQKFISRNKQYTLCYLSSKTGLSTQHLEEIEDLNQDEESIQIGVIQQNITAEKLKKEWINETVLIAGICILLILLSFYYFTHSFRALFLILFVILFNVSATVLFMVLFEIDFNIQMIALPCLIILFSFSDVLHILYHHAHYLDDQISTDELRHKLKSSLKTAIFLTSFSNLFGFLIFFGLSENELLSELALVALFSITIAYLCGRYLVINLMNANTSYISIRKINAVQSSANRILKVIRFNKWIGFYGLIAILILASALVSSEFKIDVQKNEFNTSSTDLNHHREVLTNEFYGSKSIEIAISYPDSASIWRLQTLKLIEELELEIDEIVEARYTVSPVIIVKRYNRYLVNGHPAAFKLPPVISEETARALSENYALLGGDQVIAPKSLTGRILVGIDDLGLAESLTRYSKVKNLLLDSKYQSLQLELTGISYLSDHGVYHFSKNLIFAWLLGTFVSSIILMFYLKSLVQGGIVFAVNMLPILGVVYLMPLFGLNINPQSLFLLTILAGLCVDDSIYLILNRVTKRSELSYFPIVVTSIVLAAGFLAFGFSSYSWLSPFALLFVIGILLALVLDLLILPLFMFKSSDYE